MKRIVLLTVLLSCVAVAARGDDTSPVDILREAADALRRVRTVTYQAETSAAGVLAARLPALDGRVTLSAEPAGAEFRVRVTAQVGPGNRTERKAIEAASDGRKVIIVDHGDKQYRQMELPAGQLLLSGVNPLLIRDFVAQEPFQRELTTGALTHEGTVEVDGEPCDVIRAEFSGQSDSVRWFVAHGDHLPRRVQRVISSPVGETSLTTTIKSLKTGVTVKDEVFSVKPPAGYEEPAERQSRPQRSRGNLLEKGAEAPAWTLQTPEGKAVSLKDLRGKVVLLDFWATWCGPCRRVMPKLQTLHKKYEGKPVEIIGVNCWERSKNADPAGMMKKAGFTYTVVLRGDAVARAYGVRGIPTFYLIGPNGKVLLASAGLNERMEKRLERTIEEAVEAITDKSGK